MPRLESTACLTSVWNLTLVETNNTAVVLGTAGSPKAGLDSNFGLQGKAVPTPSCITSTASQPAQYGKAAVESYFHRN